MRKLAHFAEPYSAQGNIDARAATKAIGRPQMDPWDVFLRETLQNSWDARSDDDGPVVYSVDGFWPTEQQVQILREVVFRDLPRESALEDFLAGSIDDQPVLVVSDVGTKGLGGPTRADIVSAESSDFVDFVRNVGRASDKAVGGGTYGFGKGVLWERSLCSTTIIYTKSHFEGRPVSRFMAMGHTDSYESKGKRFTGRHWWGRGDVETLIEPIQGAEADDLAIQLGMNRLLDAATGTAIMILGPEASETAANMDEIIGRIADAALWWAWPHMVGRTVQFNFTSEGEPVPAPHPDDHPALKHFAEAYRRVATLEETGEQWPWMQGILRMQRPPKQLGKLVWRRVPSEDLELEGELPLSGHSHVALMRKPRFIVKYLPVRPDPQGRGTVGVFVAHDDLDSEFATAEPVAHDDWSPSNMGLEKGARNPVRRALDLIKETFTAAAVVLPVDGSTVHQHGLIKLAGALGDLVSGSGDGSVIHAKPTRSGGTPRTLSARVVGHPQLRMFEGRRCADFEVEINVPHQLELPVRVIAQPHVLTEAGRAKDDQGDLSLEQPTLVSWSQDGKSVGRPRSGVLIQNHGKSSVTAVVTVPSDAAVGLAVTINEVGGEA